jgi:hypothetical protein
MTLTPDDGLMPFRHWLAEIDKPTAEYLTRNEAPTPAEEEAFRRGLLVGQWLTLHNLYGYRQRGVTDAETLVGMLTAGMLALRRCRSPLDFRLAMEHEAQTNDEVRELRKLDAPDDIEGGPDGHPPTA